METFNADFILNYYNREYQMLMFECIKDFYEYKVYKFETYKTSTLFPHFTKLLPCEEGRYDKTLFNFSNTNKTLMNYLITKSRSKNFEELKKYMLENKKMFNYFDKNNYDKRILHILQCTFKKGEDTLIFAKTCMNDLMVSKNMLNIPIRETEMDSIEDIKFGIDLYFRPKLGDKPCTIQVKSIFDYNINLVNGNYVITGSKSAMSNEYKKIDYFIFSNKYSKLCYIFRNRPIRSLDISNPNVPKPVIDVENHRYTFPKGNLLYHVDNGTVKTLTNEALFIIFDF